MLVAYTIKKKFNIKYHNTEYFWHSVNKLKISENHHDKVKGKKNLKAFTYKQRFITLGQMNIVNDNEAKRA